MGNIKLDINVEKIQEAERKFWNICDYVSVKLYPGEQQNNWVACVTYQNDENVENDEYLSYKNIYPDIDIGTFKEFHIADKQGVQLVLLMRKEHGFDKCEEESWDKANLVYIFRKKRQ